MIVAIEDSEFNELPAAPQVRIKGFERASSCTGGRGLTASDKPVEDLCQPRKDLSQVHQSVLGLARVNSSVDWPQ